MAEENVGKHGHMLWCDDFVRADENQSMGMGVRIRDGDNSDAKREHGGLVTIWRILRQAANGRKKRVQR